MSPANQRPEWERQLIISQYIRRMLDAVCERDGVAMDDEQREEVACVASLDITGWLEAESKQPPIVSHREQ